MRRSFVITSLACALALAPAVLFAQNPPVQQQPPATQQPAAADKPAAPKVAFDTPAGMLLVQIKPDQTAAFEEMVGKLKAGLAKTEDATIKQQAGGWKVYKASESQGNVLYVIFVDPAVKASEYDLFGMLQKVMTPDELRDPKAGEMWKKFSDAFAAGYNKLSLTPVGGA